MNKMRSSKKLILLQILQILLVLLAVSCAGVPDPSGSEAKDAETFLADIPAWSGYAFCYVNGNKPDFKKDEIWTSTQESLEPLDKLGRCGTANSCIGPDGLATKPRGDISSIEPTGWHTDTYDFVEGELLFNRCHLIGHQLSGDDAIDRNLITGTSYMNRDGMLQFENTIASYVEYTGNHVMYRVTPVFSGNELIARGVHLQAVSVEDDGEGVMFNVYCYNVQPGVDIDYKTGDNELSDDLTMLEEYQTGKFTVMADTHGDIPEGWASAGEAENASETSDQKDPQNQSEKSEQSEKSDQQTRTYVLNTNTGKFHYPGCESVQEMSEWNKKTVEATREDLIRRGFQPCGICKP